MPVLSNVFASYEICYGNRISDDTDLISSGFKITGEDTTNVYYFEKYGVSGLAIFKISGICFSTSGVNCSPAISSPGSTSIR